MKKILIAASVAFIALSSCKKEADISNKPTASASIKTQQKVWQDDAANPDNPYDDVGYWHNVALQDTRASWSTDASTFTTMYNGIASYITTTGSSYTLPDIRTMTTNANAMLADTPTKYKNFIATTSLSSQAKTYENSLMDIMFNPNFASYADFKAACVQLESTVSADKTLSAADKQTVLSSASIARHSMIYWQNEAAGENGPGTNPVVMRSWLGWIWRGAFTGGGDAAGFCAGGPAGAAVFSAWFGWLLLVDRE